MRLLTSAIALAVCLTGCTHATQPDPTFPSIITTSPTPVVTLSPTPSPTPCPISSPIPYNDSIPAEINPQEIFCGLSDNPASFVYNENIPLSEDLQCILYDACIENQVPMALMLGLIEAESNFNPDADNGQCYGLCQLCRLYFPDNLPPGENIIQGVELLAQHYRMYGTWEAALAAYNAGWDTGDRYYSGIVIEKAIEWGYLP